MLFQVLAMGVVATIAIDLWLMILNRVFHLPTTNWAMVGRWFGHLPSGKIIHSPIGSSVEIKHECALGWILHYGIGILYAFVYLALVSPFLETEPTLLSAFCFGLATVVAPWFILQPGLGLGVFARLAAKPNVIRIMSISVHSIFGVSLYLAWAATLIWV